MASRVLSEYGYFSDSTRAKVVRAANELDYRPNAVARSLRKGRTKALGILISNIVSHHWTTFVRGVEEAASKQGYRVILGNTNDDAELERAYLKALYERNVDGIIITPSPDNHDELRKLARGGVPMVLIDSNIADLKVPRINIDNHGGACEATGYLIGLGHRRIGLVAGSLDLASGVDRLRGYLDALKDSAVKVDRELIVFGDYQYDKAYQATKTLISLETPPTALLVCNELMTGAALQCLKDSRIAIPDEISLVAFDDPAWTSFFNPALTAIRTPRHYIGTLAFETLRSAIVEPGGEAVADKERILETELIIRESCRSLHR